MKPHPRGMVLILAMLGLAFLTAFALSLSFGVRQKAALLDRLTTLDELYPIAYSGVENAKNLVESDRETNVDMLGDPWAGAAAKEVIVMNGKFILSNGTRPGLSDEDGKINLNKLKTSNAPILIRLLQVAVPMMGRDETDELAYNLLDWSDSDPFLNHPQYGAEDPYYDDLDLPYGAKDLPYENLDELLLVKGMTREIFERIRPFVTVYGLGLVNVNTARAEVLVALGFSVASAESIAAWRAGTDGVEGTGDDNYFLSASSIATDLENRAKTPLDGEQVGVLNTLLLEPSIGVTSFFFYVQCHAELDKNGASMDAEAVIDRLGNTHYFRAAGVRT